jgi:hypothetical protein
MKRERISAWVRSALLEVTKVCMLETEVQWVVSQVAVVYLMAWDMIRFIEAAFRVTLVVETE